MARAVATIAACAVFMALAATSVQADAATDAKIEHLEASTNATVVALTKLIETKATESQESMDAFWTMFAAFMVFFMQAGFGMLESGTVRKKNEHNILVKNIVDSAVSGITFWAFGYAFAFGTDSTAGADGTKAAGAFLGKTEFFLINDESPYTNNGFHGWIFQWAFAATAATIVSGSVAERTKFGAYLVYTIAITSFIYPVVVHWVWGGGWLADRNMIDFAGSGVVHMTGGVAGLVGAIALGPRIGRFTEDSTVFRGTLADGSQFKPSSISNCALGTFILWFGWYGFNAGSTTAIYGDSGKVASLAATNTTLAPAAAVMCSLMLQYISHAALRISLKIDLPEILNCVLAGLVAITAGCSVVRPWAAILIGIVASVVYKTSSTLLIKLKIDDPIDASPVHFFCGWWGVLAVGIFADKELSAAAGFSLDNSTGELFAVQLYGSLAIILWTAVMSGILFGVMKLFGMLRASADDEIGGMDICHHGVEDSRLSKTNVKMPEEIAVEDRAQQI